MSSAPPAAWSAIGPAGLQASSQIETPTLTPPIVKSWRGSVARSEVALLVEHRVVGQHALAVHARSSPSGAHRGRVVEVATGVDEAHDGRAPPGAGGDLARALAGCRRRSPASAARSSGG